MEKRERLTNLHYAFISLLCFEIRDSSFFVHHIHLAESSLNTTHKQIQNSEWLQIQRIISIHARSTRERHSTYLLICQNHDQRKTMEFLSSINLNSEDKWELLWKTSMPLKTDAYIFLQKTKRTDPRISIVGKIWWRNSLYQWRESISRLLSSIFRIRKDHFWTSLDPSQIKTGMDS